MTSRTDGPPTTSATGVARELLEDPNEQNYGEEPVDRRETDQYREEYVRGFVEKWDELIDWDARAESEGQFFVDLLRGRGKHKILDAATGTGFHSVQLLKAGFDVTSVDGSAQMLSKAFDNAKERGYILQMVHTDWRWLNRDINGKFDAIICLGNSFTHMFDEFDRRRALAEFYAALRHDGILILDQRNYDAILDVGFDSKHMYYYCGDQVTAEPEHVDDGLARFVYRFQDGSEYNLNMFPLRKQYMRDLMTEAGFPRVRSYGDFQETYQENEPDFFIHVAEKSPPGMLVSDQEAREVAATAEQYYDSDDADAFYHSIWGGDDIHIGVYDDQRSIREASRMTVEVMADQLEEVDDSNKVLDIGAGYGGSGRYLIERFGCEVTSLNISKVQNERNRERNRELGLDEKHTVVHGSFEEIPEPADSFDVVWSQDAILHSGNRVKVLREVARVLKPGGRLVFTDPMQSDDCPEGVLQPILDRIHLDTLASPGFYRDELARLGFEEVEFVELTHQLRTHYATVRAELAKRAEQSDVTVSPQYVERMLAGLQHWVDGADAGYLAWGILHFRLAG